MPTLTSRRKIGTLPAAELAHVKRIRRGVVAGVLLGAFVALASAQQQSTSRGLATVARQASEGGDWPTYNRDLGGTRYSPLTQINTTNVARLTQASSYRLRPERGRSVPAVDKPASSFEISQEVTPIVVNGICRRACSY